MKIDSIKKSFKKTAVLKGITLSAAEGECIGILGGNGSGKSTLLNILAGVSKADEGTVTFKDTDLICDSKKRAELVGYVPQSTPLIEELTAKDNLRLWYESAAYLNKELKSGVLAMLGINEFIKTPVCKMSGGMKKRLSIGCAVANKPKILLLDEPSAALDLICKESISDYLADFKAKGGIIILATHDIQELSLCDRLYILKGGVLNPFEYDGDIHRLVGKL